jgi:hypothetical protein
MPVSRRRLLGLGGVLAGAPLVARAQRQSSAPRIGVLIHSAPYTQVAEGLRAGLRENGVREGRALGRRGDRAI